MKRYQFTVKEHEEYGSMGFAPKWYPNGDPLGGMAVAHDILSHFPKDDGSAEGEFQATGADLFIRGESGYFQRQGNVNPPEKHLSAEFAMTWGYHTQRDRRTAVKPVGLVKDKDLMEQCRQIVRLGVKNMKDEGQRPAAADRRGPGADRPLVRQGVRQGQEALPQPGRLQRRLPAVRTDRGEGGHGPAARGRGHDPDRPGRLPHAGCQGLVRLPGRRMGAMTARLRRDFAMLTPAVNKRISCA